MKLGDIKLIYDFNCWANGLVLSKAAEVSPEQRTQLTTFAWSNLHETLLHILDSEYVWRNICQYNRFTGRLVDKETFPDLGAIISYRQKEEVKMYAFLETLKDADMAGIVRYEAEEKVKERVLWHCLWHMVNHGTQHRSQCAMMLKTLGHSPGSMDFTFYMNQQV